MYLALRAPQYLIACLFKHMNNTIIKITTKHLHIHRQQQQKEHNHVLLWIIGFMAL